MELEEAEEVGEDEGAKGRAFRLDKRNEKLEKEKKCD